MLSLKLHIIYFITPQDRKRSISKKSIQQPITNELTLKCIIIPPFDIIIYSTIIIAFDYNIYIMYYMK